MTDTLHIDGSQGEGGGQILRSSLALSAVTGRPCAIENIRAGRQKPGLMRQHLTAVRAVAEICGAEITGAEIGSRALTFHPGAVQPGEYRFSVGTAGSATLVLQSVLPALLIANAPSRLTLEGGTHNPWAPPFDFLDRAYLPLINRMGPRVSATLEKHGFYPAGGGRFAVDITPASRLRGFDLLKRGDMISHAAKAIVCNLPAHIAERELKKIAQKTGWSDDCLHIEELKSHGPGNVVFIEVEYQHIAEVFTGFGEVGVAAERVAGAAIKQYRAYIESTAPVGPYLADQWLLPLGISAWQGAPGQKQAGGVFLTLPLTRHASTHIDILRTFLGIEIDVERLETRECLISVRPSSQ